MSQITVGGGRRRTARSASLAVLLLAISVTTALATAGTGFGLSVQGRGVTPGAMHYNVGDIKLQAKAAVDFVAATVTIATSGNSGWHSHPGLVLVTVLSGTITLYQSDCSSALYPAGTSFVEPSSSTHLARNESSTTPVLAAVTFIVPAGTAALRVDQPDPGCSLS